MSIARKLVFRRGGNPPPAIGLAVLGEILLTSVDDVALGKLRKDLAERITEKIISLRESGHLTLCGLGGTGNRDPLSFAVQLRQKDPQLGHTDSIIVANALSCRDCRVFYTNDPGLLYCKPLLEMAEEYRITIREAPP